MSTKRRPAWMRYAIVGVSIVAVIATIAWLARVLFTGPAVAPKKAQQITLLKTPPPPPPPKPQERPPEPVKREEVKINEPKPQDSPKPDNEPPPLKPLGIDADGVGAGDGFGLAANKGGRDITSIGAVGTGNGLAGAQRSLYGDSLQRHIQAILARQDAMRLFDHRTYVDLWIGADGKIQRAELEGTTARRDADAVRAIEAALAALIGTGLRETPPPSMSMPVRVRLSNRGAS